MDQQKFEEGKKRDLEKDLPGHVRNVITGENPYSVITVQHVGDGIQVKITNNGLSDLVIITSVVDAIVSKTPGASMHIRADAPGGTTAGSC